MRVRRPSGGAGGEGGRVRVERNGHVQVFSGSFPQGQGHATTFAQIAAERLKVAVSQVEVIQGDTDRGAIRSWHIRGR